MQNNAARKQADVGAYQGKPRPACHTTMRPPRGDFSMNAGLDSVSLGVGCGFHQGDTGVKLSKNIEQGDDFMTDRFYIDRKDAFTEYGVFVCRGRLQRACGLSVVKSVKN